MSRPLVPCLCLFLAGTVLAEEPARDLATVKKALAEIDKGSDKLGNDAAAERQKALRRLKAYRYLAGVPHEPLPLDDELSKQAQAAAVLCEKLGRLDHDPPNAGLPEAEYQLARKGAGISNLSWGPKTLPGAIDNWMDDTDPDNIGQLGHRRWCLNPALGKVGMGRSGAFAAMACFDQSRKAVPDYDAVCFPARGAMPSGYFEPRWAWSVSLNPKKYREPDKDRVKVSVHGMKDGRKSDEALRLEHLGVDTTPFGIPNAIIFLPANVKVRDGQRYWVEITGLTTKDGKPATLKYTTEFKSLN
jgi:hypothetical protein